MRGGRPFSQFTARSRSQRAHAIAHRYSHRSMAGAVDTNIKAVAADQHYHKIFGPPKGFLNVYVAHNRHMLAYAAMMTGQRELAMKHIRAMVAELPQDFLKENALQAEGFVAMPLEVMVRFGLWDEILAEPDRYPRIHAVHPRISSCSPRDRICSQGRYGQRAQSTERFSRTRQTRAKRGVSGATTVVRRFSMS